MLELELTAQPRPLAEELGSTLAQEDSLSLDPEDLGSHFLSEAIEQGDPSERDVAELELALLEQDELEETPDGSDEISVWTDLIDRASEDTDLLEQIESAAASAADQLDAEREEQAADALESDLSVSLTESSIHEASLLDREGAELDETLTPAVEAEDGGRHARTAHDVPR